MADSGGGAIHCGGVLRHVSVFVWGGELFMGSNGALSFYDDGGEHIVRAKASHAGHDRPDRQAVRVL